MAFLSKVGNMLRQTANRQITSEISASRLSIYQAIRCMSSSKLFVGGISFQTDDNSLKEAFDKYGNVVEARIIMDRETGRSRGFGFITYTSSEEASSAIQAMDGQDLHGRRVRVNYATERPQRTFNNNYGNYGGGSYGGGGYGSGGGGYGSGGGYRSGGGYAGGGGYGADDGGNYSGRNSTYGGGNDNYAGQSTYDGAAGSYGGQNNYDGGAGNYGVAGGGGGSENCASTSVDGGNDGNAGVGYGSNQFGANESSGGGFNQDDALDSNYKDDDDAGDFAKRA